MSVHSTRHRADSARHRAPRARAFTIVELLVVIALIVLLVAILLAALSQVQERALKTRTNATMEAFANACEAFSQEHGYYPGIVPEDVLVADAAASGGIPKMSAMEAAILHLLGGYVREIDVGTTSFGSDYPGPEWQLVTFAAPGGTQFRIKINLGRIGQGPVIQDKPFPPYLAPNENELRAVNHAPTGLAFQLPDLVDAWGQPIAYVRRERTVGPLNKVGTTPAQFDVAGMKPYTRATDLGKLRRDQIALSLFNAGGLDAAEESTLLAWLLAHPALAEVDGLGRVVGEPRGAFMLLSAGGDGVYFSIEDGPGSPGAPVLAADGGAAGTTPILDGAALSDDYTAKVFEEYDDLLTFGGT
jgi:type II secretory pathway pseudopilin PulG